MIHTFFQERKQKQEQRETFLRRRRMLRAIYTIGKHFEQLDLKQQHEKDQLLANRHRALESAHKRGMRAALR